MLSNLLRRLSAAFLSYFTREKIIAFLKSKFIAFMLEKLIKNAATGGFKAWLVKFISTKLFDQIGEPVTIFILNEGGYQYERNVDGKLKIKRLRNAQNSTDYDDAVDDILN